MVMDWSRSGKKTQFRLFSDNGRLVPVRVYFCFAGAKFFPEPHAFGLCEWNGKPGSTDPSANVVPDPSDVNYDLRKFDIGLAPAPLMGQHYCGPLRYFQDRVRLADAPEPLEQGEAGQCKCCWEEQEVQEERATTGTRTAPGEVDPGVPGEGQSSLDADAVVEPPILKT